VNHDRLFLTMRSRQSIFRADALRRHMGRNDKSVFPKLVRPRTFASLWVLLGLLVASGLLLWHAVIPFYTPAIALVVERNGSQPVAPKGPGAAGNRPARAKGPLNNNIYSRYRSC